MSQDIELYTEKVAELRRRLVAAKARLAHVSPSGDATIRREIAIAEAMLPVYRQFETLMRTIERLAEK